MKKIIMTLVLLMVAIFVAQQGLSPWTEKSAKGGFLAIRKVSENMLTGQQTESAELVFPNSTFKKVGGRNYGLLQSALIQQSDGGAAVAQRLFVQLPYQAWRPL
jgi:hypothetical protein